MANWEELCSRSIITVLIDHFLIQRETRLESIVLQNLPIMLFGISLTFYLLCLFLCFRDMDYADISYFQLCNFAENNHDRNEIDLD